MSVRRRALATLGLLGAHAAAWFVPAPGVDVQRLAAIGVHARLLELGIVPAAIAYLGVEIAAVIVPKWRARRLAGPEARLALERVATLCTLAVAGLFAAGVLRDLYALEKSPLAGDLLSGEFGGGVLVLSLVAGAGFSLLVARALGECGLINGFVALGLWHFTARLLHAALEWQAWPPLASLLVFSVLPVLTTWLCLASGLRAPPNPASSLQPIALSSALLALPLAFAESRWLPGPLLAITTQAQRSPSWLLTLAALSGWLFARAFNQARRGVLASVLYVVIIAASEFGTRSVLGIEGVALTLSLATALVADLRVAIARHAQGTWVVAWREPRPHLVHGLCAELRAQGIEVQAGSLAQGVLLRFFGPYAMPELWVRPNDCARARTVLQGLVPSPVSPARGSLDHRLAVAAVAAVFAAYVLR